MSLGFPRLLIHIVIVLYLCRNVEYLKRFTNFQVIVCVKDVFVSCLNFRFTCMLLKQNNKPLRYRNKHVKQRKQTANTSRATDLLPIVDVENFPGEVEVDIGVVGVVSCVGDGDVQRHVLHSSQGQMGFAMQSGRSIKKLCNSCTKEKR